MKPIARIYKQPNGRKYSVVILDISGIIHHRLFLTKVEAIDFAKKFVAKDKIITVDNY
jgi:hypothetical protein